MTENNPSSLIFDVGNDFPTRYYAEEITYSDGIEASDSYWVISDSPILQSVLLGKINARHTNLSSLTQLIKDIGPQRQQHLIGCAGAKFCSSKGDWVGVLTEVSAPYLSEGVGMVVVNEFLKKSGLVANFIHKNFMQLTSGVAAHDLAVSAHSLGLR